MVKWPPTRTSKRLRIESPVYSPVFFWWGGYVTIRHFTPKIRVHPGLCVFWPSPGSTLSFLTWGLSVTIGEKTWTSFWSAWGCLERFVLVGVKQQRDLFHYLSTSPIGGDVKYLYIILFNAQKVGKGLRMVQPSSTTWYTCIHIIKGVETTNQVMACSQWSFFWCWNPQSQKKNEENPRVVAGILGRWGVSP